MLRYFLSYFLVFYFIFCVNACCFNGIEDFQRFSETVKRARENMTRIRKGKEDYKSDGSKRGGLTRGEVVWADPRPRSPRTGLWGHPSTGGRSCSPAHGKPETVKNRILIDLESRASDNVTRHSYLWHATLASSLRLYMYACTRILDLSFFSPLVYSPQIKWGSFESLNNYSIVTPSH